MKNLKLYHLIFVGLLVTVYGCGARQIAQNADEPAKPKAPSSPIFKYAFDENRAFADLETQVNMGPRNPGSIGHKKCLEWIQLECRKTADKVFTQSFVRKLQGKDYNLTNVFAVYGTNADKWVVLCAHWDTRPIADQEIDPVKAKKPIPGANDGASGVAALLELGRLFKENKPPVGVIMIYYDGEDYGTPPDEMFLGSTYFSSRWRETLKPFTEKVEYGILLDMIGYKNAEFPKEQFSVQYAKEICDQVWEHARMAGLERHFPNTVGPGVFDDHIPMNKAGIPTINIISFNYPYWHTLEDTPDKCSPYSLKIVGEVVARMVYGTR